MFTIEYKGAYINGYCDKRECKVIIDGRIKGPFSSFRSAQIFINRHNKNSSKR